MADIISLGTVLLTKINNVAHTYDDVGRTAKALQNMLSLVVEFTKIRVGMSNPLDPELASQLQDIFTRLDNALINASHNINKNRRGVSAYRECSALLRDPPKC